MPRVSVPDVRGDSTWCAWREGPHCARWQPVRIQLALGKLCGADLKRGGSYSYKDAWEVGLGLSSHSRGKRGPSKGVFIIMENFKQLLKSGQISIINPCSTHVPLALVFHFDCLLNPRHIPSSIIFQYVSVKGKYSLKKKTTKMPSFT